MSHLHGDHGGHASADAAGAASWMVAMVVFLALAAALVVALFVWAPWDDDNIGTGGGVDNPVAEEGAGEDEDTDVNISGDIDVKPDGE